MLEPRGPLPAQIYWRRRGAAIAALVAIFVVVIGGVFALRGGSGKADPASAAATDTLTTTSAAPTSTTTDVPEGAAGAGDGAMAGGAAAPAGAATTAAAAASGAVTSVAPGQCADSSLAIKVVPEKATYAVGEEPNFIVAITNISTTGCDREVGAAFQQVQVWTLDGKQRMWSSLDCFPSTQSDVQRIDPGKQIVFKVAWSGKTSTPECLAPNAPARTQVAAGDYRAVAQLGELKSAPEPFRIG